jgi:hypothetical protein
LQNILVTKPGLNKALMGIGLDVDRQGRMARVCKKDVVAFGSINSAEVRAVKNGNPNVLANKKVQM